MSGGDGDRTPAVREAAVAEMLAGFLAERPQGTRATYGAALADFARFCDGQSASRAVAALLQLPEQLASRLVARYRDRLVEHGFAPASVNLRLSALSSLVARARAAGLVGWTLAVARLPASRGRRAVPPERDVFRAVLAATLLADGDEPGKGHRDRAILHLLHDVALRPGELVALDLGDLQGAGAAAMVTTTDGRRLPVALPPATRHAVRAWLAARRELAGETPLPPSAPLFVNLSRDPGRRGGRLSVRSVRRIVTGLAALAGVTSSPLGLRRAAIADALELTQGDVRAVQRFSRLASPQGVLACGADRAPADVAGLVAAR